jgi:D-3-phosphoglycerate dehydrogenase
MRPRVLTTLDFSPCPGVLGPLSRVAEILFSPPVEEEVRARIGDCEAYLASLHLRLGRSLMGSAARLRVIATPSTGTDHIDLDAARERGIAVISLKDDSEFLEQVTATAELAWGLLLAVVRRLPAATDAARRGQWARDRFRGHQLSGRTLGIIGYGRLGRMTARIGRAFRMRVVACDVREVAAEPGVEMVGLDRLLAESDVVSLHVHLDDATRGLLGPAELARMKPGSILLNTSRGGLIDEEALLAALRSGQLAGAGLDVIDGEWRSDLEQHPLVEYARTHEHLVITPHIGGVTYESQELAYTRTIGKLAEYLLSPG